jgi:hypothetical protein
VEGVGGVVGLASAVAVATPLLMPAHGVAFLSFVLIMVVLLLLICYLKGEPPAW